MADQKRWFKVWTSLLVDMDNVSDEAIGRWTRLGCRAALVGTAGAVDFDSWSHLSSFLRVPLEGVRSALAELPGLSIEEGKNRNGGPTVTFKKWKHYQEDSTRAERARASRSKRRGEENRGEQKRPIPPNPPAGGLVREPIPLLSLPPESRKATPQPEPPGTASMLSCPGCREVLAHLNNAAGKNFHAIGLAETCIHERHLEHGVNACLRVIDLKVVQWKGKTQHEWKLRPVTLFEQTKFDGYLNEPIGPPKMEFPEL